MVLLSLHSCPGSPAAVWLIFRTALAQQDGCSTQAGEPALSPGAGEAGGAARGQPGRGQQATASAWLCTVEWSRRAVLIPGPSDQPPFKVASECPCLYPWR